MSVLLDPHQSKYQHLGTQLLFVNIRYDTELSSNKHKDSSYNNSIKSQNQPCLQFLVRFSPHYQFKSWTRSLEKHRIPLKPSPACACGEDDLKGDPSCRTSSGTGDRCSGTVNSPDVYVCAVCILLGF